LNLKCAKCWIQNLRFKRVNLCRYVTAESHVHILMAERDIYVARIAHRLTVKLGPLLDMPQALLPMAGRGRFTSSLLSHLTRNCTTSIKK
jgi:hypothetical protein